MSVVNQQLLLSAILLIVFAIIAIVVYSAFRNKGQLKRTTSFRRYYVDTDLRLTYSQYMKIHPDSNFSYNEFKKAQAIKAYSRSGSSKDLKRMVR